MPKSKCSNVLKCNKLQHLLSFFCVPWTFALVMFRFHIEINKLNFAKSNNFSTINFFARLLFQTKFLSLVEELNLLNCPLQSGL
jgi:hypothetical protein